MDHVKQLHCLGGLVRLKASDGMEPNVRMTRAQPWPFGEYLLNAILTKVALSGRDQCFDLIDGAGLADGDQLDVGGIAPGELGGSRNAIEDLLTSIGGATHRRGLYKAT